MKLKTLILGPFMFCMLWFLGWESYAVYDAREKTEAIFASFRNAENLPVRWDDLDARRQSILLQVEDPKFWTHKGVDLKTPGAGITTITQSLAKWLYFEKFTPGFSKIEQSLIALFVIDPRVPKPVQLDTYLNIAYFGEINGKTIVGFDAAARTFFRKRVPELTERQFLQLVAALVGPNTYTPGTQTNLNRMARIQRYIAGKCRPKSSRDTHYENC